MFVLYINIHICGVGDSRAVEHLPGMQPTWVQFLTQHGLRASLGAALEPPRALGNPTLQGPCLESSGPYFEPISQLVDKLIWVGPSDHLSTTWSYLTKNPMYVQICIDLFLDYFVSPLDSIAFSFHLINLVKSYNVVESMALSILIGAKIVLVFLAPP